MDYPINTDTICMELSISYLKGASQIFYKMMYFYPWRLFFI